MTPKNSAIWTACSLIGQICAAESQEKLKTISQVWADDFKTVQQLAPDWGKRIVDLVAIRRAELEWMEFHGLPTWQQLEAPRRRQKA